MKIVSKRDIGGKLIKDTDVYTLQDNPFGNNLTLSSTFLRANKSTNGHSHAGQEEVYFFTQGSGSLILDGVEFFVSAGDVWAIPDGAHHKVCNMGECDMVFQCVFN